MSMLPGKVNKEFQSVTFIQAIQILSTNYAWKRDTIQYGLLVGKLVPWLKRLEEILNKI